VEGAPTYAWHALYRAAVLGTDDAKLPARIIEALKAIEDRLSTSAADLKEHAEIQKALIALAVLQKERVDGSV